MEISYHGWGNKSMRPSTLTVEGFGSYQALNDVFWGGAKAKKWVIFLQRAFSVTFCRIFLEKNHKKGKITNSYPIKNFHMVALFRENCELKRVVHN